jgi:hypothetical protein
MLLCLPLNKGCCPLNVNENKIEKMTMKLQQTWKAEREECQLCIPGYVNF